jgi:plasmid rolling circle replication initiator protein Rep
MDDSLSDHDFYLTDVSPKDKPWDIHRAASDAVRDLYRDSRYKHYATRIDECSPYLGFAVSVDDEYESKFKLQTAFFCRVRNCPTCQWRRSMKWRARFFQALPSVYQDYPTVRWVFVTLTVKNCPVEELRETLEHMSHAWNKFSRRKVFPGIGWVRSVEVTRAKDGTAHPHYHCLIAVPASYFGNKYLKQAEWTEFWRQSLKVDYTPIVDVRSVKPKSKAKGDAAQREIFDAVCETFKYSVKESDLTADRFWLGELTDQLHKTRAIATGGILKQYLIEKDREEVEDLIHIQEDNTELENREAANKNDPVIYFGWREKAKRYVKAAKIV